MSPDFFEKLLILLMTALVTGFLVPYILKRIDEAKDSRRRILEAELARQAKVIEAQSKFLDDITEILWRWRYLSIRVTYHGSMNREELYVPATKEYEVQIWDVLNKLRNQISKSRRLVSQDAYRRLVRLYDQIVEIEAKLSQAISSEWPISKRTDELSKFNLFLRWEMTERLDEVIDSLAQEVRLKSQLLPSTDLLERHQELERKGHATEAKEPGEASEST